MEGKMITIPVEEYKKLLEGNVRIGIFADFVRASKYSIEQGDCGRILGFKVDDKED